MPGTGCSNLSAVGPGLKMAIAAWDTVSLVRRAVSVLRRQIHLACGNLQALHGVGLRANGKAGGGAARHFHCARAGLRIQPDAHHGQPLVGAANHHHSMIFEHRNRRCVGRAGQGEDAHATRHTGTARQFHDRVGGAGDGDRHSPAMAGGPLPQASRQVQLSLPESCPMIRARSAPRCTRAWISSPTATVPASVITLPSIRVTTAKPRASVASGLTASSLCRAKIQAMDIGLHATLQGML